MSRSQSAPRPLLLIALSASVLLVAGALLPGSAVQGGSETRGGQTPPPSVLLVASDVEDVRFGKELAGSLSEAEGREIRVEVLYLGSEYSGADEERERLSDTWFLRGFSEIWIPDLNVPWTEGGAITEEEIRALGRVVGEGRVLLVGLNTYSQSWSPPLEELTGVELTSLNTGTGTVTIHEVGGSVTASYDPSLWWANLRPSSNCSVLATSEADGSPAIVACRSGGGAVLTLAFNPVVPVVESKVKSGGILELVGRALSAAEEGVVPRPPPAWDRAAALVRSAAASIATPRGVAWFASLSYAALLGATLVGYAPYAAGVAALMPLRPILRKVLRADRSSGKLYSLILDAPGRSLPELEAECEGCRIPTKVRLAAMEACGLIDSAVVRGVGRLWFHPRDRELVLAMSLAADPLTWRVLTLISERPGLTPEEIAVEMGAPLERVVRLVRWLVDIGAVAAADVGGLTELYPSDALRRAVGGTAL